LDWEPATRPAGQRWLLIFLRSADIDRIIKSGEIRHMPARDSLKVHLLAFSSILPMAFAWRFPGAAYSACLGWLAVIFTVMLLRTRSTGIYKIYILSSTLSHGIAFYWMFDTARRFGGYGIGAAAIIFLVFLLVSSLIFIVFIFLYNRLGMPILDRFALRTAVAWAVAEFISFRLFPWHAAHTQVAFTVFIQAADLAGVILVSFLMFWVSEASLRGLVEGERNWRLILPVICLTASIIYGYWAMSVFDQLQAEEINTTLVQGNIPIKSNEPKMERYLQLSQKVIRDDTLLIWPEVAIEFEVPTTTTAVAQERWLPFWSKLNNINIMLGAKTYDYNDAQRYNSVLGITSKGSILPFYHKRILMPFGEYVPGASLFPFLNKFNPNVRDGLQAGNKAAVFSFIFNPDQGVSFGIKAAPLICYEDLLPGLSREAVLRGANLLINFSNDAWFGNTVAPFQHNVIASFRAVENKRYLLRSTNTGLTAIVDPLGRTRQQLAPYQADTLSARVRLIQHKTLYTWYTGDLIWWLLTMFVGIVVVKEGTPFWRRQNQRAIPDL
jgi:apolipoprotein N-acyltransferase